MIYKFKDINVKYETGKNPGAEVNILFIHGFTGSGEEWRETANYLDRNINAVTIDLPGFGGSDTPEESYYYSTEGLAELINEFTGSCLISKPVLCGYSMGGRLAFNTVFSYQRAFGGLIIESATPGISDPADREIRRNSDEKLVSEIVENGVDLFIEKWLRSGIFDGLEARIGYSLFEQLVAQRRNNRIEGMVNSLRNFGAGVMNPVWNELKSLEIPVLLISGSDDSKYGQILKETETVIKNSERFEVAGAGHNVHLEKPEEFAKLVNEFIKKFKETK